MTAPDDRLAVALVQLAEQGAQISALQERVTVLQAAVDGIQDELAGDPGSDSVPYRPGPAPYWWLSDDDPHWETHDRDEALGRLTAWVEQVYRPGYGHLAARLPACWHEHRACLFALDWMSELWATLYLQPRRDLRMLTAQAEWHVRLLPAAADAMEAAAERCEHRRGAW